MLNFISRLISVLLLTALVVQLSWGGHPEPLSPSLKSLIPEHLTQQALAPAAEMMRRFMGQSARQKAQVIKSIGSPPIPKTFSITPSPKGTGEAITREKLDAVLTEAKFPVADYWRRIITGLKLHAGDRLIQIGGGSAGFLIDLPSALAGVNVTEVDPDQRALQAARQQAEPYEPRIGQAGGSISYLASLRERPVHFSAEAVVLINVLSSHLTEKVREEIMSGALAAAKPGGTIVLGAYIDEPLSQYVSLITHFAQQHGMVLTLEGQSPAPRGNVFSWPTSAEEKQPFDIAFLRVGTSHPILGTTRLLTESALFRALQRARFLNLHEAVDFPWWTGRGLRSSYYLSLLIDLGLHEGQVLLDIGPQADLRRHLLHVPAGLAGLHVVALDEAAGPLDDSFTQDYEPAIERASGSLEYKRSVPGHASVGRAALLLPSVAAAVVLMEDSNKKTSGLEALSAVPRLNANDKSRFVDALAAVTDGGVLVLSADSLAQLRTRVSALKTLAEMRGIVLHEESRLISLAAERINRLLGDTVPNRPTILLRVKKNSPRMPRHRLDSSPPPSPHDSPPDVLNPMAPSVEPKASGAPQRILRHFLVSA